MNEDDSHRYEGGFPKIGIRPIVDRRKLVKEALAESTMELAREAAAEITAVLRYPDGSPVEVVIFEPCISGITEAARCAEQFRKEGVGVLLTVASGWCYPLETIETDPTLPHAVWGFNGTERPGAVYLAALHAAHNQKGLPLFKIYGRHIQDQNECKLPEDVRDQLIRFTRAAMAVALLRGKSYLSIGSVSMGIAGCIVDENFYQRYLGMRNAYVDMTEVNRRLEQHIYNQEEFQTALAWVTRYCQEGPDPNPESVRISPQEKSKTWETSIRMAMIVRDLMIGNPKLAVMGHEEEAYGYNAIASGFQGQREWTDYQSSADVLEAVLCSSFDWNGIREPYMVATENDNLNAVTMLLNHYVSYTAQIFADVRAYWSPEAVERVTGWQPDGLATSGFIHLINSGPAALDGTGEQQRNGKPVMKPHWEIEEQEVQACLDAVRWRPTYMDQFAGGGYSTDYTTRGGMPVTMARINLVAGVGPVLQLAEGYTVELPDGVHEQLDSRTTPTWPTTWFVPNLVENDPVFGDVYSVMEAWGSNHCAVSYGHIGADLITLASILRIPVNMHNIDDKLIFRPSAWSAFGTKDLENADYRACAAYGPLYR
ncbi:L-fucose isomerase [Paenibacillus polysaccharolyticus]|uniref:L-fucose isomerase n=1 Tax=Paenibacillus polysaccharolyticus TaxID=582692 RepID=UPI0020A1A784|nr:L-fucose isomerase [Paenibacillus polysaccharolyticus]MCP1133910.1 L-fucose isomerase [Paenibacillus polysaccharolyticus]